LSCVADLLGKTPKKEPSTKSDRKTAESVVSSPENRLPHQKNLKSNSCSTSLISLPSPCDKPSDISAGSTRCISSAVGESCDDLSSERRNIVIVDGICEPSRFARSEQILKEINSFAPTVQVKYAYSLARGGVAIHVNHQPDKDTLITLLSKGAFGCADIYDLASRYRVITVKGVPLCISVDTVKCELEKICTGIHHVERSLHTKSGKPLLDIRVKCSNTAAQSLLAVGWLTQRGLIDHVAPP